MKSKYWESFGKGDITRRVRQRIGVEGRGRAQKWNGTGMKDEIWRISRAGLRTRC